MLQVAEAQRQVLERVQPLPPAVWSLGPEALGLVLAEDVVGDIDMPPFDKSLMDGYAVRSADLPEGRAELDVIEEVTAGQTPRKKLGPGQATRIMTGAPLPDGADAVVMVERTRLVENTSPTREQGARVAVEDKPPKPDQNILRRGREMRAGEVVLSAGARIRPQELGILATVGRTQAQVIPRPRLAVMSTGDEIVEAAQTPGPGQIRNGNGPMLVGLAARAGALPTYLGNAKDRLESLRPMVEKGLQHDVLVLTGGVSAGKLDLVPGVLADAGVDAVFHKVQMKPGKPVFFGYKEHNVVGTLRVPLNKDGTRSVPTTFVFGLPGNPVSSMVCFELFVRPAIRACMGLSPGPHLVSAEMAQDYAYRSDRVTYHPAILEWAGNSWKVRATPWFGSADLRGVNAANAFVILPPGDTVHKAGTWLDVLVVERE
ncbi:MAG: molybdopterin molybdotransferase MoeA [Gemmataceae bacterium]|nr:molybdopterin molybdotransferase MoeA [Gemmataceae bacterium]MCI0743471.1 molybdopterin molybdotransferase MoeA [Gemmataceae bacterium]